MRSLLLTAVLTSVLGAGLAGKPAQADSMNMTMLANPCAGCHGTDGNSKGGMPSIAGKSVRFITSALKDFRDGNRTSTVMQRIAKGYSDAQIEELAKYYSGH
jgi:cytochrome c553